ncbi:ATP synthase subunit ATP5MJ, mitochondrial [Anolis carolinensis]|uniref:ATP synthase subunit ATP5MJ, mitochondrial n=1 Tax=Anolis carolinensis TaxID=28377 RepID=UPI0004627BB4|nr:PREDICTED: 6.8 kDa mitochondrial proteolipid [Anolis carolinensis]|eukprot:XP_008103792.1 PREDICTED: 6.8 kDa mitochondrial proteolipid [Anolis carolinensis]
MLRSAVQRWWDTHKIYHTQVFQELWVGIILTGYVYYKISYGGKKSVEGSKKSSGHH